MSMHAHDFRQGSSTADDAVDIALILDHRFGYTPEILDGIRRYVSATPSWAITMLELERRDHANAIRDWDGEGLICCVVSEQIRAAADELTIPWVNVAGLLERLPPNSVIGDDLTLGELAAEHLLDQGFEHFACYHSRSRPFADRRLQGFTARLDTAGHRADLYHDPDALISAIHSEPRGSAAWGVLTLEDAYGAVLLRACRKAGLQVPEHLAVMGIGNHEAVCELANPPLSSVDGNLTERGYQAAALLHRMLRGLPPPSEPILIPPSAVMHRASTDTLAIDDTQVARALRFIRSRADEPTTAGQVAEVTEISRRSLEQRFKRVVGRTISDEIWRTHVQQASRLLRETDLPMVEIAVASGFNSRTSFSTVFRKRTGLTPTAYRNLHRLGGSQND